MKFHHAFLLLFLAPALFAGGCNCSGSIGRDEVIALQTATQTLRIHNATTRPITVLPEAATAAGLSIDAGGDATVQFTAFRSVRAGEMVRGADGRFTAAGAQALQVEGAGPVHFVTEVGRLGNVRIRPSEGNEWNFTFHLDDCLLASGPFVLTVSGPPLVGLTTRICPP